MKTKQVRVNEDLLERIKAVADTMPVPPKESAMLDTMIRKALPEWERAYLIVPAVRGGKRKMVVKL